MAETSLELKLREIFPTIDEETIHAVYSHHGGDSYAAMLQLIELLGDDEEALEVTFALLQAEELDEAASQMAADEQLALALQEELATSDAPAASSAGAAGARSTVYPARKKTPVKSNKLSTDASRLLAKFGRSRAKTGTQRLLDVTSVDSADVPDELVTDAPESHPYSPNVGTLGMARTGGSPSDSLLLSGDSEGTATGVRTGGEKEAQYNARLMRARASRQPSTAKRDEFHSIMTNA